MAITITEGCMQTSKGLLDNVVGDSGIETTRAAATVPFHRHCQKTVCSAYQGGQGLTRETLMPNQTGDLANIQKFIPSGSNPSTWQGYFTRNSDNITEDLRSILELINKMAGNIVQPFTIKFQDNHNRDITTVRVEAQSQYSAIASGFGRDIELKIEGQTLKFNTMKELTNAQNQSTEVRSITLPRHTLTVTYNGVSGNADGIVMDQDRSINLGNQESHVLTLKYGGNNQHNITIPLPEDKTVALKMPIWSGAMGHKFTAKTTSKSLYDNFGGEVWTLGEYTFISRLKNTSDPFEKITEAEYNSREATGNYEQKRVDSRGFGTTRQGFLKYTAQSDCFLYIMAEDNSGHYGDGFTIYTLNSDESLGWPLFRHVELFKGEELRNAFQLPVVKGAKIGIAFHIVKFSQRIELDTSQPWNKDSPFAVCDVDLNGKMDNSLTPPAPYRPPELDDSAPGGIRYDPTRTKPEWYQVDDSGATNRTWEYMQRVSRYTMYSGSANGYMKEWYYTFFKDKNQNNSPIEYKFYVTELPFATIS